MSNQDIQSINNAEIKKKEKLLMRWQIAFALLCLFVVAGSVFCVILYITTIQSAIASPDINVGIQSSSDILNLSIPILGVFAGLVVSFLGLKKFETIDEQLEANKKSMDKKLNEEIEKFQAIKIAVTGEIDKNVSRALTDKSAETITAIKDAQSSASNKIKELEDSIIAFLADYQWLIDSKESLDKIQAHNIPELYSFVKNSFSNNDTASTHTAIAVVQKVIKEQVLLGDENHFYNLATVLAQRNYTKEAVGICSLGLKLFPNNLDLLSCLTLYNAEIGDFESAKMYAELLEKHECATWNWRAFTFSINYYNYLPMDEQNKVKIIQYIEYYKQYLPFEEKAYMAAYETYTRYGQHKEAIEALECATEQLKMAPQCSMKLADHYREIGEFDLAIQMATKAIIGNAEDQENANTGAIYACRGLAKDAKIHQELLNESKTAEMLADYIHDAIKDLNLALKLGFRQKNIIQRITMLKSLLLGEISDEQRIPIELLEMLKNYTENQEDEN